MQENEGAGTEGKNPILLPLIAAFGGGLLAMLLVNGANWLRENKKAPEAERPAAAAGAAAQSADAFVPPDPAKIPSGPDGDSIRRGMAIFNKTPANATQFVGDALSCTNCHLDGGRTAHAAPMWAAWGMYPKYRSKNGKINNMEDRIRGCFMYSMNAQNSPAGKAPEPGSAIYRDLENYFHWLATGAPTGEKLAGAGYPKLKQTALGYDPARGAKVYGEKCAACHGADGQGQHQGKDVTYPPLWGPHSFNWGAGMANLDNASGFIKANMPFGNGNSLTDQEAWDVAAYVDSHERPKDPRQTGSVAENAAKHHKGGNTYYGKVVDGKMLGGGVSGAGPLK